MSARGVCGACRFARKIPLQPENRMCMVAPPVMAIANAQGGMIAIRPIVGDSDFCKSHEPADAAPGLLS